MGKYSSDSDSNDSGRGRRSSKYSSRKGRSRSSSTESSHRRHKKRCKGRRSRSKERYSKSSRRRGAKSSYKRTSSSDSSSDDSRRKNRRSPVSSSSSAANSMSALPSSRVATPETSQSPLEQLRAKDMRASQAAKIADTLLRQRRGEVATVPLPLLTPHSSLLDEINGDSFVQRAFSSSATAPRASLPDIPLPVVVDLTEEPKHQATGDLGVMSPLLLEDQEGKQQRWIKKLFSIRQKALHGEPMVT